MKRFRSTAPGPNDGRPWGGGARGGPGKNIPGRTHGNGCPGGGKGGGCGGPGARGGGPGTLGGGGPGATRGEGSGTLGGGGPGATRGEGSGTLGGGGPGGGGPGATRGEGSGTLGGGGPGATRGSGTLGRGGPGAARGEGSGAAAGGGPGGSGASGGGLLLEERVQACGPRQGSCQQLSAPASCQAAAALPRPSTASSQRASTGTQMQPISNSRAVGACMGLPGLCPPGGHSMKEAYPSLEPWLLWLQQLNCCFGLLF